MITSAVPFVVSKDKNKTAMTARVDQTARQQIMASFSGQAPLGNMGGGGSGYKDSYIMGGVDVATPYIDPLPQQLLCRMFEDIYLHDSTCGTAVDILANTPFSNFTLHIPTTRDQDKIGEVFRESIHNLKMSNLLPIIARERMVYGAHISMLLYRESAKAFTDIIGFNPKDCNVYSAPVYGRDPVIKVNVPQQVKEYMALKSESVAELKEAVGDEVVDLLNSAVIELEPITTLHIPNKVFGFDDLGHSMYRRVLPLYILEKVLHRGTVTMANRRQSSILHIQAGAEDWEPTQEELSDLIQGINKSLADPIGAVIATNNRVNFNEINPAGDLWRWNDIMEQLHGQKLIAMGINESIMNGDATYNNLEQALQIMLTQMDVMRNQIVTQTCYNKLFPLISRIHGFTKDAYGAEIDDGVITAASKEKRYESGLDHRAIAERSKLVIPFIKWEKTLVAHGGDAQIEMMDKLAEKGVPFSLRSYAMAAGYDIDDLVAQAERAKQDDKNLKKARKAIGMPEPGVMGMGEDGEMPGDETARVLASLPSRVRRQLVPALLGATPNVGGPFNRIYSDAEGELREYTNSGQRKWVFGQDRRQREMNEKMIMASRNLHNEQNNFTISYPPVKRKGKKGKKK